MIEVRQTDVFAAWFAGLKDHAARARITARIRRLSLGHPGDAKTVGDGVSELRVDYGPGYRIYFTRVAKSSSFALRRRQGRRTATSSSPKPWRKTLKADMARETPPWDAADALCPRGDRRLSRCRSRRRRPRSLNAALGDIARAKGMTEIAQEAGVGRANLYKALSPDGNPEFATVAKF